jgi:competence protein ComEC
VRLLKRCGTWLDGQRGALFPWAPVFFASGIATYFALKWEPGRGSWLAVAAVMAFLLGLGWVRGPGRRLVITALLLALAGFSVAGQRAHSVAEPVLAFRYYGPVEGRIVAIDRSASDAVRLTLDRVRLKDVPRERTPARVRIALHGVQGYLEPEPGLTVIATAHLSPPAGAVEPGGYDFRRQAWFQRLGAVGYTRVPVLAYAPHEGHELSLAVYRLRMHISRAVQDALPSPVGGFAAAITTGDRSGMDSEVLEALRASNLAHLLAISGLHMGLLTGFVFSALRLGLASLPGVGLLWPVRKIAAIAALCAGAVYLALSGGNVATERAFIMVAVMFAAVLVDRRAITLRSVAVAALIVLSLRPEALYGPGFQMSFAATTALVAVYGAMQGRAWSPGRWPVWIRVAGGVALSSFVAGMATAPISAAHFNQVPHYGLIANIVSVPLMGAVIIPAAVVSAVLAPLGLGWVGLKLMEWPILWILSVARTVSGWPGSVSAVIAPGPAVLPLMALGALWIVIVRGRARAAGMPLMVLALVLWWQAERPLALISQSGGLVGVMTPQGRALSKPKGDGFAATSWLENDGDRAGQAEAHGRAAFGDDAVRVVEIEGLTLFHATGKRAAAEAVARCREAAAVVVNVAVDAPSECEVYDAVRLDRVGALAIEKGPEGPRMVTARQVAGARLWSQ